MTLQQVFIVERLNFNIIELIYRLWKTIQFQGELVFVFSQIKNTLSLLYIKAQNIQIKTDTILLMNNIT